MKAARFCCAIVFMSCLICSSSPVSRGAQAADPEDAAKEKDIQKLMDITGAGKLGVQVMNRLLDNFRKSMPQVPKDFWDQFQKQVNPEDLQKLVEPIYAKHFTDQDIKELIRFYQSPIGQKTLHELPQIVRESMAVGQAWGQRLAEKVTEQLRDKGYLKNT